MKKILRFTWLMSLVGIGISSYNEEEDTPTEESISNIDINPVNITSHSANISFPAFENAQNYVVKAINNEGIDVDFDLPFGNDISEGVVYAYLGNLDKGTNYTIVVEASKKEDKKEAILIAKDSIHINTLST